MERAYGNGKTDLYGIFNAIRPVTYPHRQERFCVFAQLVGGRGNVPFFVDIVYAREEQLIHTTTTNTLRFPGRSTVVQLALTVEGCRFEKQGIYLIVYCDNICVADASLLLR